MKGIRLKIEGGVMRFSEELVEGVENLAQKLMVNTLTRRGSDSVLPSRGTKLHHRMARSAIFDLNSAQHALNFSTLEAKASIADFTPPDWAESDRLREYSLEATGIEDGVLKTNVVVIAADDSSVGRSVTINP